MTRRRRERQRLDRPPGGGQKNCQLAALSREASAQRHRATPRLYGIMGEAPKLDHDEAIAFVSRCVALGGMSATDDQPRYSMM
jgi:hypothetical protein